MTNHDKILVKWAGQPTLEIAQQVVKAFREDTRSLVGQICSREKLIGLIRLRTAHNPMKMFNAIHLLGYFDSTHPGSGIFTVNRDRWRPEEHETIIAEQALATLVRAFNAFTESAKALP